MHFKSWNNNPVLSPAGCPFFISFLCHSAMEKRIKRACSVPSSYRLDAYVHFPADGILAFVNIHSNIETRTTVAKGINTLDTC